jgi:hypothetical protein
MRYQAEIARSGAGTVEAGSGDVVVEGPGAVVVAGSADGSVVAGTVVDRPVVAVWRNVWAADSAGRDEHGDHHRHEDGTLHGFSL